jgi:hypothetical protein
MVGLLAVMVNRKIADKQRIRLKDYLLEHLANDELPRGILKAVAGYEKGGMRHNVPQDVTSGKKGSGFGLKYNHDDIAQAVPEIPLRHRSTVWLLEGALAISRGTIHRLIRTGKILRSHASVVRPMLTEENKLHLLEFCLNESKQWYIQGDVQLHTW